MIYLYLLYFVPMAILLAMIVASFLSKRFSDFAEVQTVDAVIMLAVTSVIPCANLCFVCAFVHQCSLRTNHIRLHK